MYEERTGKSWNICLAPKQPKSGVYLKGGYIPGVSKLGYMWLIPTNAEKPIDGRTKQGKERDKK